MNLNDLGYSDYFKNNIAADNFKIGRIITVNKESYVVSDGNKEYFAKLTGNLIYSSETPEDFPTVGDFVSFQIFDDESLAIIHNVVNRKTLLKRKTPGKKIEYQLIAANVDYAIIIQGLDSDRNLNRLERYLSMVNEFGIEPIVLFSKTDLLSKNEIDSFIESCASRIHTTKLILLSNFDEKSIEKFKSFLIPRKTYCLIGSSGVGKTTLLNNLIGEEKYSTREVRIGDDKGRHTTTNRNLIMLKNGSMLIDTPGMRELANISVSDGIEQTFDDFFELSKECKYSDCTHTVEKGCGILEAVENGIIDQKRYDNFIKLKKESDYYERSYFEKRRRDKEFGKMVKSVMKEKKKR